MQNKLEKLKAKHAEEIKAMEREIEINKFFMDLGIDFEMSVFDTFISMPNVSKEDLKHLLETLEKIKEPMYLKKADKLSDGYTHKKNKFKEPTEVNSLRVSVNEATRQKCTVHIYCKVLDEVLDMYIDVSDAKSKTSVDAYTPVGACKPIYSRSKLHTTLTDIDGCKVQTWGTHARGLHQYTVWFTKKIDLDDFIKRL